MKKLLLLSALSFSMLASTCSTPIYAQTSWPEYSLYARTNPVGIRAMQRLLSARGYKVQVDGRFGKQTEAALARFQKSHGLRRSGIATAETWKRLVVRVGRGSKGQAVRAVQEMLALLGFKTQADGVFGSGTERALKSFQKARGLTADGIAGPQTWSALLAEVATKYD